MGKKLYIASFLLTITSFLVVLVIFNYDSSAYASRATANASEPIINDSNLTESERAHRDEILKERDNIVQDLIKEYKIEAKNDLADQNPSSPSPTEG